MEQVRNKGAAVEDLGGNFLTMLSSSIVNKFAKEFEKRGTLFTPELSDQLRKLIVESYNETLSSSPSPVTEEIVTTRPILEQLVEGTLPPLVFQVDQDCVVMGMMINGKPEVVRNEIGSESTPRYAGFTYDSRLIYGTDARTYCKSRGRLDNFLCTFRRGGPNRTVRLKKFGIFNLPALFFDALLIRKLKITAEESQCNGSQCQAAILAVPMETTSVDRLHLKDAALFAGFKDAFVISAEGLAAYYWFRKNETERKENNYSKDFVIVNFSGAPVLYKRSFEAGTDGKKHLAVTPVAFVDGSPFGRPSAYKEDELLEVVRTLLKDENVVIPVVKNCDRLSWFPNSPQSSDKVKITNVDDDESDPFKYFAAKGAALLSGNPENIGRQVRSMMETLNIEPGDNKLPDIMITCDDQILPETIAQRTFNIKHDRAKYQICQQTKITVGYLVINGVKLGSKLQVTYEWSWEGIWKVVGVSAKNPSDTDEGYRAVSWEWLIGEKVVEPQFGSSLYEECKSLLLKFVPSPIQAKVASSEGDSSGVFPPQTLNEAVEAAASGCSSLDGNGKRKILATKSRVTLPNDMNRFKDQDNLLNKALSSPSQVKRRSARLTKVGSNTSGFGSSPDQSVGFGSSTTDSGDGNGTKEKKRSRKGMVIRKNGIVVNQGFKKIKLERDWVDPVVKIEQDLVDGLREDGNGQQVNFVQQEEEIKIEEDVVKIEVEEQKNMTD